MKAIKSAQVKAALACFLILLSNTASAHNRCRAHRREKGYYTWLDRGRYLWLDRGQYRWDYCRPLTVVSKVPRYPCYPCYMGPYHSVVIKQPAAVIERRFVIAEPRKYEAEECELLKRIRQKKSELFRKIKEGNKEQRRQAIEDLAGFSSDPPVRAVLKKVLLSDPEPEVRRQAAKSLGRVNNWKALPALKKAQAEDPNEEVRKEAAKAVKKVKEKFLKKLKEAEKLFGELKNKK